jgi:Flp pilus assembly protein TadG
MQSRKNRPSVPPRTYSGIIQRLTRHQGGSVLPMMAMAIIPLAGLVGGGVDMSRMYLTKARLQQACDAGALAGRKVMGSGSWGGAGGGPETAAIQFFDGNFKSGAYGTTNRTRAFVESSGKVTGTASAVVPMTVMKVFGLTSRTISVTCDAELRLPNTDIMFVLDTTGSMDCRVDGSNCNGDSNTKIAGLRKAVKCFYEVVAKLDVADVSNTDCGSPPATSGTSGVQIRFGFMPYATNVNVGKLLPTSYFANDWPYQSRERVFTNTYNTDSHNGSWPGANTTPPNWGSYGSWTQVSSHTGVEDDDCDAPNDGRTTGPETSTSSSSTSSDGVVTTTTVRTRTATWTDYRATWTNQPGAGGLCLIEMRTRTREETRTDGTTQTPIYTWHYKQRSFPIGTLLKNGTGWHASFDVPINHTPFLGANKTITWDGCIEERRTVKAATYSPIPADAEDLDIDQVPSAGDPNSLWAPALPGLIYNRPSTAPDTVTDHSGHSHSGPTYACPDTEAKKLQAWTPSTFQTYVNALNPEGSTYHDIGMLWGARFISPTGIFASENATTPQGGAIERHLIFMTDGETCTRAGNYFAYGYPTLDKRQSDTTPTDDATCPGSGANSASSVLNAQVDARFAALCEAVKNKNITLWVVYFGNTDAATTARMHDCARTAGDAAAPAVPARFFNATNTTALITTFRNIADQISQLRLTN